MYLTRKGKDLHQEKYRVTKLRWTEKNIYIKTTSNKQFLLKFFYPAMHSSFVKRNGAPLTDNEKFMIINVYNYFSGANSKKEDHQKGTLRKRVAEALGVAEGTVGSVVSDWKSRGNNSFTPHKTLGRPKLQPDENISEILRTKILYANKTVEQLSTHTLRQFFAEKGYNFSR